MIRLVAFWVCVGFILFCAFVGAFWIGQQLAGGPV